ncbi:uncharacterized protein LOC124306418 [Neodiprion virginianus]|uniref:uncharacterized protein LOC124306418 n=1 Tax=Neodiprion virginianus TaxID=2961670 RepID=UPI001EE75602|nr:uncharacterized protein LOC124306418 [Neodiprion virginianus]
MEGRGVCVHFSPPSNYGITERRSTPQCRTTKRVRTVMSIEGVTNDQSIFACLHWENAVWPVGVTCTILSCTLRWLVSRDLIEEYLGTRTEIDPATTKISPSTVTLAMGNFSASLLTSQTACCGLKFSITNVID